MFCLPKTALASDFGDFFIAAWACSPFYYYAWNEEKKKRIEEKKE